MSFMPSLSSHSQSRKFVLKPADEIVLHWLNRFHYLNAAQICRLSYSRGSLSYVQAKLKTLVAAGLLQRIWLPRREPRGSSPAVYTLARKGINYLRSLGVEVGVRFHPSEQSSLSYLFLNHTLELNDVLIAADLLCRSLPAYRLAALRHERELKREAVYVRDHEGRKAAVIPDAWLDLRIREAYQVCIALELDRGTEEQKRWRRKVANLIAYANGPYQEAFHTRSLTIAVLTTAGDKRLLDLLRWTEAELKPEGEGAQGDLFLFTSLTPAAVAPEDIFIAQRWYQPFHQEAIALLDGYD